MTLVGSGVNNRGGVGTRKGRQRTTVVDHRNKSTSVGEREVFPRKDIGRESSTTTTKGRRDGFHRQQTGVVLGYQLS